MTDSDRQEAIDNMPKSQEYQNFEAGLRQVLSVSKEELDRRVKAEKQAGKKKAKTGQK